MAQQMKAIHHKQTGSKASECLELQTIDIPTPGENDLLVKIGACAVNPVDTKIRQGAFPASDVTGFDAAGIVESVGSSAKGFSKGDAIYYSGALGRPGSTAQYNLIDYRLAALKPKSLDMIHAATVPLVSITAWELLEEHWKLQPEDPSGTQKNKSILIINGAGGVGSIATQLARKVFSFGRVIVTASRPETIDHAKRMGATHVIDHHKPLKEQIQQSVGVEAVEYIMICYSTNTYMDTAVELSTPLGNIGSIVEISEPLQGMHSPTAFMKALNFTWELMLSKTVFSYDMESHGNILRKVAKLFDEGKLESLLTEEYPLSVENLVKAHDKLESGKCIGKIGLTVGEDIQ